MSEYSNEVLEAVEISSHRSFGKGMEMHRVFSIILFAVFVIVDLFALVVGAHSYGSITQMQAKNDQLIMTTGPILSNVRASDAAGGVATGKGPEGNSLVLVEHDSQGSYETRIYLYKGNIVQEYALGGSPYTPEKATVLAESGTFTFSYEDGLLTIATDAGISKVALRNLQGGA
jgi:hypothetical protein